MNLDTFKSSLQVEIYTVLKAIVPDIEKHISASGIDLTHPKEEGYGDYSTAVAFKLSKILKKPPLEIADIIISNIKYQRSKMRKLGVEKVEVKAPGFINFWLTSDFLSTQACEVLKDSDNFGKNTISLEKLDLNLKKLSKDIKLEQFSGSFLAVVEFTDPNPFKEFHIGHLRNISLGESFSRLLENLGAKVIRANYQGDVGSHVAKAIWGVRKMGGGSWKIEEGKWVIDGKKISDFKEKVKILAKGYVLGSQAYEENKAIASEINKLNLQIYQKDPLVASEWQEGRKTSLEAFEEIYQRVGTKFDRYYFESEVAASGVSIVKEQTKKGIFQESDGAIIFDGEKFGLHKRVFITKEDYATYEAKDLALAILKYQEYQYGLSVITTGSEQSEYFKVMLKALSLFRPDLAKKTLHLPFGMVSLKSGKMASRTGNVITGQWLLDEAKKKANRIIRESRVSGEENYSEKETEEITEKVALSAVKYSMLKFSPRSDISFDFEESVSLEGDSGPYLLYTYARCKSVLRRIKNVVNNPSSIIHHPSSKLNPEELVLLRTIYRFPEVVFDAGVSFSPNLICTFIFDLAQKYNLFYAKHSILTPKDGGEEVKEFRLALTAATSQVIKNGLRLLGIPVLERM